MIKTPGFYDNEHLHICSICLRLAVSSLTEIQYLQIEPGGKGTHTDESMMLKMFYLYGFIRWTKCIRWTIENSYLLVYKLFEFLSLQSEIKQKLSSVQKITLLLQLLIRK